MGLGRTKGSSSSPFTPMTQKSPFGTLSTNGNTSTYTPNYFPGQQDILKAAPSNEANILTGSLPTATSQYQHQMGNYLGNLNSLTADNMVNPQVYAANYHLQADPLLSQYHTELGNLESDLAAQNLTGGSYDALAHGQLGKNLTLGLSQASNNAVNSGLGATGDYLGWQGNGATAAGNQMTSLGNLANQYQSLSSNLQSQLMNPFQDYTKYQETINPLQAAGANYALSQPTGFQQGAGAAGSFLQTAAPFFTKVDPALGTAAELGSAGLKAAGNAYGNPNARGYMP